MDIGHINTNKGLPNNTPGKTNKSEKPEHSSLSNSAGGGKSQSVKGDSVNLSGVNFASEIDFARTTLNQLKRDNLSSLKKIKQQIEQGTYKSGDIHDQIGTLVKDDLKSLSVLLNEYSASGSSETISAEHKDFLLNNDKVLEKVTGKIVDDLNKI